MINFRKCFTGLAGGSLFVFALATLLPLTGRGQGQGQGPHALRQFYVTQTLHDGSQALSACASGYHMASLWEILDPSNLKYNTELGFTHPDSGSGPPSFEFGWIRNGHQSNADFFSVSNCSVWTSPSQTDVGTAVALFFPLDSFGVPDIGPWKTGLVLCSAHVHVWCIQD